MSEPRLCALCAHTFMLADQPKYRRCRKAANVTERADAALAAEMRKAGAPCGPDAKLWEARA